MATLRCDLDVRPAAADSWSAVATLFGPRGACAGCWCMWFRKPASQFDQDKGERNENDLQALVRSGEAPGLLGYHDGEPVGWVAAASRADYPRLARSQVAKPASPEAGAWLISCLFVRRDHRGHGHARQLVSAAAAWAFRSGATVVQAIPTEPASRQGDAFVYTGVTGMFTQAGFTEVARNRPTRPLLELRPDSASSTR